MDSETRKRKIIVIAGPTASGKSALALKVAKRLNGEIISADSMQIYEGMDIGTAKTTMFEMDDVPHHMINVVSPMQTFSVAEYSKMAIKIVDELLDSGKVPIIVGGTGFYIDSILFPLRFAETNRSEEIREELWNLYEKNGADYLFDMLKDVDSESAEKLHKNDIKRVIRALEIFKVTGKPKSSFKDNDLPNYDYLIYAIEQERENLYERINQRVDKMIECGLIDEVIRLKDKGCDSSLQSMQGIGYKEILRYLNNEISLNDAIYEIKKNSRNYAKRQMTYFRRNPKIKYLKVDEDNYCNAVEQIVEDYKNNTEF